MEPDYLVSNNKTDITESDNTSEEISFHHYFKN